MHRVNPLIYEVHHFMYVTNLLIWDAHKIYWSTKFHQLMYQTYRLLYVYKAHILMYQTDSW